MGFLFVCFACLLVFLQRRPCLSTITNYKRSLFGCCCCFLGEVHLLLFPLVATSTTSVSVHQVKYFKWPAMFTFFRVTIYFSIILEHFRANRAKTYLGFLQGPRKRSRSCASGIPWRKLGGITTTTSGELFWASTHP